MQLIFFNQTAGHLISKAALFGIHINLIKSGKPPALPGDSQGFDRSHGPIILRSSTKSTKENRHERLQEFGTYEMGL